MAAVRRRAGLGRDAAAERLVPGRAGWAVALLAAVLTFLAVGALAAALAAERLAADWGGAVTETATLTIVAEEAEIEAQARSALEALRATPGIRGVRVIEPAEQRALLAPWLGSELPVEGLALPLMIEVTAERDRVDAAALTARLAAEAPGAIFDDHSAWRLPLAAAAERQRWAALAVLGMALAAVVAAAAMAGRAAVATAAPAVGTLRLIGAADRMIARAVVGRVQRAVALGGAAGAVLAALVLARAPADAAGALPIGLAAWEWLLVPAVTALAVGLAAAAARAAVRRGLRRGS